MDSWTQLVRWQDAVDVAAVAVFVWLAIRYLRLTRARAATLGLLALGAVYAVATALELRLTAALFQGFFAALVIVLVVVFQEDIRRFLERLGSWRPGRPEVPDQIDTISTLVRVVQTLAAQRIGALIVLPRGEPIDRHIDGGIVLNGRVSGPLLHSLFDASSPGHDGAVIVRKDVVERFAAHLPLSANHQALRGRGTRHAAALGLAERCDAICIVVSEERGSISIARDGELHVVQGQGLATAIMAGAKGDTSKASAWQSGGWGEAAVAITLTAVAWVVFVPGSDIADVVLTAKIKVANLPEDLRLDEIDPVAVDITLRGPRRDLVLADEKAISVQVDAYLSRFGRRTFSLEEADVRRPSGLSVVGISPEKVRISLNPRTPSNGNGGKTP